MIKMRFFMKISKLLESVSLDWNFENVENILSDVKIYLSHFLVILKFLNYICSLRILLGLVLQNININILNLNINILNLKGILEN